MFKCPLYAGTYNATTPTPFPFLQRTPIVPSDVAQGPGGSLLHARVKLLQADNQGVKSTAVHHGLRQLGRVLGHRAKNKGSSLLVETLKEIRGEWRGRGEEEGEEGEGMWG